MKNKSIYLLLVGLLLLPINGYADSVVADKKIGKSNVVFASIYDDRDQPCYAGGKYVGTCSRNSPYYNVLSGECYSTLQDCKRADGDLSDALGHGNCTRCGK
jgi:hypothetical protein